MITFENERITEGHIARHTPTGSGAPGREAAIIDIAQDFLLAYLEDAHLMDDISLKGGTAIRKFYAGKEGRFSLDLDFAVSNKDVDLDETAFEFISEIDGLEIGPFRFSVSERRSKWYIGMESRFESGLIHKTKLDFAPFPWLEPIKKSIVPLPIHKQYGADLPKIQTNRLEENMAEKIARLNRTSTARDMYDLNWIMENKPIADSIDRNLLRRLVVLKIWVDSYGMHCGNVFWHPAHSPSEFDPEKWLNNRNPDDVASEDIGALAVPAPKPEDMIKGLQTHYSFLRDLDETDRIIACSNQKDRSLVIRALSELPGKRLAEGLY